MTSRAELDAWLIPAEAKREWLRLAALLDAVDDVPCRADPESWWVGTGEELASPVEACRSCAARVACLDYALAADERFGIWGATLPHERRAMRWAAG